MEILKTNLEDFKNIENWEYKENFHTVNSRHGDINIHYVDENSDKDETILLMHGNPTWGYLYRNMIDPLKNEGYRVVVPDLPGFGKSDKFTSRYHYTYEEFVDWMSQWIEGVNLENITLFCQHWFNVWLYASKRCPFDGWKGNPQRSDVLPMQVLGVPCLPWPDAALF